MKDNMYISNIHIAKTEEYRNINVVVEEISKWKINKQMDVGWIVMDRHKQNTDKRILENKKINKSTLYQC